MYRDTKVPGHVIAQKGSVFGIFIASTVYFSYTQTYLKPLCSVSSIYSAITAARGAHKPPEARSSQPKRTSSSNISRNWKRNSCSTLGHQSLVNWLVGNCWVEKKKRNTSFVLACIFFRKPWVSRVIYATWFQGNSGMYSQCGDVLFLLLAWWRMRGCCNQPLFSPKDIIDRFRRCARKHIGFSDMSYFMGKIPIFSPYLWSQRCRKR